MAVFGGGAADLAAAVPLIHLPAATPGAAAPGVESRPAAVLPESENFRYGRGGRGELASDHRRDARREGGAPTSAGATAARYIDWIFEMIFARLLTSRSMWRTASS